MIKGTTPTYVIQIDDDVDFSTFEFAEAAFRQRTILVRKTGEDVRINAEAKTISVSLTQEETLRFDPQNPALIQIRIKDSSGKVFSHPPIEISIIPCLSEEVI